MASRPRTDRRRPYKVAYHYDGTRNHDPETGALWIDTTTPIDGKSSHTEQAAAEKLARDVSRRGGRAEVTHVHPDTGAATILLTLAEFEVALAEMTAEVNL
jgi:hypothetical protein